MIYGSDAHRPENVYLPEAIEKADRLMEKCQIPRERLIDRIDREAPGWLR